MLVDCQSHQLDEQDALDEEVEAIRLQKKQADELNEDDFALPGVTSAAKGKKPTQDKSGKAAIGAGANLDVERIHKTVEQLTKEEKMKLVAEGVVTYDCSCVTSSFLCQD